MKIKHFYLAKHSGSQGVVFDFSSAEIIEEQALFGGIPEYMDREKAEIEFGFYDDRINLYAWSLVVPFTDGSYDGYPQHYCWLYSTSKEYPYLTEFTDPYEE